MPASTRLEIRPFTPEDATAFFELTQDYVFNLYPINVYRQENVEAARDWIQNHSSGKYVVIEKATGSVIGMGGLTKWTWEGEELFDITYRLRGSAVGKGLGWELAEALVNYGLQTLRLPQITATITPDNLPSKKIAERLGLKFDKRIILKNVPTDLYRLYRN